jgi:hypothetical protein
MFDPGAPGSSILKVHQLGYPRLCHLSIENGGEPNIETVPAGNGWRNHVPALGTLVLCIQFVVVRIQSVYI